MLWPHSRGHRTSAATPTAEGTALHTRLAEAVAPRTKQLFAGFDPDDLATAHRVLAQVVERADHLAANLQAGLLT